MKESKLNTILSVSEPKPAQERAEELRSRIKEYLMVRGLIFTGKDRTEEIEAAKERMLEYFGATEENWQDWKWHIKNRITDPETLSRFIQIPNAHMKEIKQVGEQFRWAISPYFASLMDPQNAGCPIRLQTIPCIKEVQDSSGSADPMLEELHSPVPGITRRYPDRLIINVTNCCAAYCRHCQRRRNLGTTDKEKTKREMQIALDYIKANKEIRDVLITGGDALLLSDQKLDWLLTQLDNIKHVEIKRIGTRVPVTLPQRVTPQLCQILAKHSPIYINTQFNHPKEITDDAATACDMLVEAGAVLGNQSVLLKNINNNMHIMKKLNHELLKLRVRPYYIFQAKQVLGTRHFVTDIKEGIEIMEYLRGYTSGLAIPSYVINAPGGLGKIPLQPNYIVSQNDTEFVLRTWEGKKVNYSNVVTGEELDIKPSPFSPKPVLTPSPTPEPLPAQPELGPTSPPESTPTLPPALSPTPTPGPAPTPMLPSENNEEGNQPDGQDRLKEAYDMVKEKFTEKVKSRKFFMAIVSSIVILLNQGLGWKLPEEAIYTVAGIVISYILGQSAVDIKTKQINNNK